MTRQGEEGRDCAKPPLLSVRALSVALGGKRLVQDLSIDVMPGQRWCVLGPNGSGKTTLLNVLAGMRAPEGGEVRLDGRSYPDIGPRTAARRRAMLLQSRRFAFRMSVRGCVSLGRHPHLGRFEWPGSADRQHVDTGLQIMDLRTLADRDVLELSGGEQQRTHLATILVQEPNLFLLDEPTTHLDLRHQAALFSHLRSICEREGRAVIFSTHELSAAAAFATHALLLAGQGVVHHGPCATVLDTTLLTSVFGFPLTAIERPQGRTFVPLW
jgi:iron complex transport system ATP-binding protein